ncbi:hypothetical protein CHS0354_032527 [Potamilus streckersoni]|uniref:Kinesin-like protein KIF16B n=1 Tax=Potamilus streckersoni TaxID=2493646 RepID=A0AAE0VZ32_9BIVA|nr:hypothetical protein CHS0354_032527 [Potamilus streckersoni]
MTSVKVAVRVRPLNTREINLDSKFNIQMDGQKTIITNTKVPEGVAVGDVGREAIRVKAFTFDFSFWSVDKNDTACYHSQEYVYQCLGVDVVQSGYEGYNACVFAYGQTGSGKTYTMMGNPGDEGLIPRICKELFARMFDEGTSYRTEVSYLEIYNEKVRDLLKAPIGNKPMHSLRVREHPKDGPYVQGLSRFIVNTYEDIEELIIKGNGLRTTASTNMNDVSSRSHAIFTIVFTQATIRDGIPSEKTSKIHLVDLAGSERATATGATGVRLREGGSINKSLVSLGNVISQLAEMSEKGVKPGKNQFIPYRDSVLTWLLKDSLGGNSRTIMVTTISPADVNYAESLSALRYANRAKNIINRPTINEDPNVKLIQELREEISRLRSMIGGDNDIISSPKVKEKLHESEARMKVLTEEWTEKWKDIASILKEQNTLALRKEGHGIVLDSTIPHLIGIDDDILSTGIMLCHLKEGKTKIGRADADEPPDIVITREEIEKEHCVIENNNGDVTLYPINNAQCHINGSIVTEPTKLTQGDVIVLGQMSKFRFNHPAEAAKMKKGFKRTSLGLSRTSLLSHSMTDLYKSSENISWAGGVDVDKSHREEHEKWEEIQQQMKEMERKYHEEDDERINRQVAMEIELEKKHRQLELAEQELWKISEEYKKTLKSKGSLRNLPKGQEIEEMLQKLDKRETQLIQIAKTTKETLLKEIQSLRNDQENKKTQTAQDLACLEEKQRDTEVELRNLVSEMDENKVNFKANIQKKEELIHVEEEQLDKLQREFEILFHSELAVNENFKETFQEIESQEKQLLEKLDVLDSEMKETWKQRIESISVRNKDIEEAWHDLSDQEKEYDNLLKNTKLSDERRAEIEAIKEELSVASSLLKDEEEKLATEERQVLDGVEKDMDLWEHNKGEELAQIKLLKSNLIKDCRNSDLKTLQMNIEVKENSIKNLTCSKHDKEKELASLTQIFETNQEQIMKQRDHIHEQKDKVLLISKNSEEEMNSKILDLSHEINSTESNLQEELRDIQSERKRLLLLKTSEEDVALTVNEQDENIVSQLESVKPGLTLEEQKQLEEKIKKYENLQSEVEDAQLELEEKVRIFDEERDRELDRIEFEKMKLQEMVRQDRINALVEQEVKRRLFEEKLQRDQIRQLEREKEKMEREEEIRKLKDAHVREIKQLKAKYEKRSGSFSKTVLPSKSNPYATVLPSDDVESEVAAPRRKSTGSFTVSTDTEDMSALNINIAIPSYRLQSYGSDTHYEYEVKIRIGEDMWTVYRRYSRFRQFHQDLRKGYPEVGSLVFPPKKLFSKTEKVASERQKQLEFYLRGLIEICSKIPTCNLHPSNNKFLTKKDLHDFDPFFRPGLFETTKHTTS